MGMIPSIGKRGFQSGSTTNPKRAESVTKQWNFLLGMLTKGLRVYGEGATAGAALVASDADGNVTFSSVLPATRLQLTGQTANSTGTMVASGAATGEWIATVYAQCTTAGSAGTLDVTFSVTDDVGAATITAIAAMTVASTGRGQGVVALRCSGGGIDYTAAIAGGAGNPQYALHINLVRVRET